MSSILIVGESPTRQEKRTGNPFLSEGGKILQKELQRNDLFEDCKFVYLINRVLDKGENLSSDEIREGKEKLLEIIKKIKPEYLVTLGVLPTKTFFRGKAKINESHGELIEDDRVDYIGFPTFHPAYTLRDPSKRPGFDNDIRRLAEHYYNEAEDQEISWGVVRRGNFREFIRSFRDATEFAFDCETSGLFPYSGLRYLTAIVIALPEKAWVIPGFLHPECQDRTSSPWCHGDAFQRLMNLLFDLAEGKQAYAWNGKFDNTWLHQMFGRHFRLTFDGMLASHILNENVANDLTSNCRTYLGVSEYDIPLNQKNGKLKKGERPSTNWKYCAEDGAYTLRLVKIFKEELKKDERVERLFYNLTMPAARALEEIEMEGLTIDTEMMEEVGLELIAKRSTLRRRLNELAGREINWNSPAQVGKVLYGDLDLPYTIKTAKGNPSTSEEAILELKGTHEIADCLIEYRETAKFLSTYIIGFKKYMVDNKMHISYKIHGTVTGRYSSRIHSIPRDTRVRNLITAPSGWEFVQGDISQAELRVIAQVSSDPEMRKCFTEDIDMHWRTFINETRSGGQGDYVQDILETASEIAEEDITDFYAATVILEETGPDDCIEICKTLKEGRKKAKAVNFGYVYGMYPKKFIQTAKVKYGWEPTLDEAERSRKNFFQLYSRLEDWHNKQKKLAHLNGAVRTLSGRLRRLPGITSRDKGVKMEAERQAVNSPIQGFIGDYKAMVMVEIHETMDRDKLRVVGEHHDAVLMIVKTEHKQEVLPQCLKIMRKPKLLKTLGVKLEIPMEGDLEVGPWGRGYEFVE